MNQNQIRLLRPTANAKDSEGVAVNDKLLRTDNAIDILEWSGSFDNINSNDSTENNIERVGGLGLAMILIVASFSVVIMMLLIFYLERNRHHASNRVRVAASESIPAKESVDDRYRNIEKWLVSKKVEPHDKLCDTVIVSLKRNLPRKVKLKSGRDQEAALDCSAKICTKTNELNVEHAVPDTHDCPICFDSFLLDEIVSWSPTPQCHHVFHHHCIKEWLLENKECPFCREIFIPVDRIQGNLNVRKIGELLAAQQNRLEHCYYCVQHGIVRPPSHCFSTNNAESEAIRIRSEATPTLGDLSNLRGLREENRTTVAAPV